VCIQGGEGRGVGTGTELQRVRVSSLLGRSAVCAVEGWVGDCGGGVENIFFFLLA